MYLLKKESMQHANKFISREKPLREYVKELEKYKTMISGISSLPVYVPLNFYLLDCSRFHKVRNLCLGFRL